MWGEDLSFLEDVGGEDGQVYYGDGVDEGLGDSIYSSHFGNGMKREIWDRVDCCG